MDSIESVAFRSQLLELRHYLNLACVLPNFEKLILLKVEAIENLDHRLH